MYQNIYLYGEVGSGKSMIVDKLYLMIDTKYKLRTHLHLFMQYIYSQIATNITVNNIIKNLNVVVIIFDEFSLSDETNAVLMKEILLSCKKI